MIKRTYNKQSKHKYWKIIIGWRLHHIHIPIQLIAYGFNAKGPQKWDYKN